MVATAEIRRRFRIIVAAIAGWCAEGYFACRLLSSGSGRLKGGRSQDWLPHTAPQPWFACRFTYPTSLRNSGRKRTWAVRKCEPYFLLSLRFRTACLRESNELRVLVELETPPDSALSS